MKPDATITCPKCGAEHTEHMPTNACQHQYTCPSCGATLETKGKDCCVFCSYGDTKCPAKQQE